MSRDEALRILKDHNSDIMAMGVRSIAIFGSTARDEAHEDSDIDILVEFDQPATFDGYLNLKAYLEGILGRSVDLVTNRALKQRIRPYVEKEAIYVS